MPPFSARRNVADVNDEEESLDGAIGARSGRMAEPDAPIMDVAFLALQVVPLRSDDYASNAGFGSVPPRGQRLRVLCEAYGDVRPEDVLDTVTIWHRRDRYRTTVWGAEGGNHGQRSCTVAICD